MPDDFYVHRPGLGNVGSYQVSGHPYVTSSSGFTGYRYIQFPYVVKHLYIKPTAGSLRVYFTDPTGSSTDANARRHYFNLSTNSIFDYDVKCKEIYISGSGTTFSIFAELTNISTDQMFTLTGSGLTD